MPDAKAVPVCQDCKKTPSLVGTVILETWHVVNGLWRHLVQIHTEEGIRYYTDGKLEDKRRNE